MNNDITKEIVKDGYASAFLEVANIVAPFCNFSEVKVVKTYSANGVNLHPSVKGLNVFNNLNVEVTTETEPREGLQIVVNYFDDNGNLITQTKCYYFCFNWKALMVKAELNNK